MKNYCICELAALAALTFASCSSESVEDLGGNQATQQVAIGFDGYLGRSAVDTRGSESTTDAIKADGKGFGVFGNYSTTDGSTPTYGQNLFLNQSETYSSAETKWTYSPVKYWPTEGHIDFLAYAPYDKTQKKLLDNKNLVFTVNSDVTTQIDFLWANAANQTKANNSGTNKVKFNFNHALAKIGYSVKSKDNYDQTTITVKSIKLVGSEDEKKNAFYTKGTIDLSKANGADALWETVPTDTKQNFTWFTGSQNVTAVATNNADNNYLFVIPQDFSGTENNLYVVVEYTVKTGETAELKNKVSRPITTKFLQGKAYMINLIIGLTPIEFEAKVESWINGEDIGDIELN